MMQITKHPWLYFLPAIFAVTIVAGCNKSNAVNNPVTTTYFINFKANGTAISNTDQQKLVYTFSTSNLDNIVTMSNTDSTSHTHVYMRVDAGTQAMDTIVYTDCYSVTGPEYGARLEYTDANGKLFTTLCNTTDYRATVKINEIKTNSVKGTFYATLRQTNDTTRVWITDGSFYVGH